MTSRHRSLAAHGARVVDAAAEQGLVLRLVGGVGVFHALAAERRPAYEIARRPPGDVDVLAPAGASEQVAAVMGDLGFVADERVNAWHGHVRQCWALPGEEDVAFDVFLEKPPLCHDLDFSDRLELASPGMQATDLLMQKLQIVELNQKDLVDAGFLLLDRGIVDDAGDPEAIHLERLLDPLSKDWGFFHTTTKNLRALAEATPMFLRSGDAAAVGESVALLSERIEAAPKSRRWRMRAKVGTRAQWYEDVEEIDR
ncbi:MAG: hypothetical protein QM729_10415 [Solirubrobacterales bacterium]